MNNLHKYSQSQIKNYLLCPYNYYIQYILGKREPKKSSMWLGEVCHQGFASLLKKEKTLNEAVDEAEQMIKLPKEDLDYENNTPEDLVRSTRLILTNFNEVFGDLKPTSIEETVEKEMNGYALVGIIDAYFDSGTYLDWKTVNRFKDNSPMQIVFYSLFKPITLGKYISFNREGKIQTQNITIEKEKYFYEKQIFEVISLMETGLFPKTPVNWKCQEKYCAFYDHCHNGKTL